MKRIQIGRFFFVSACCLAFSQAAVFAQEATVSSEQASEAQLAKENPKVQKLMNSMELAIQKARAAKNTKQVSAVIVEAARAEISDAAFGSIVAMAVRAFPAEVAPFVQTAIAASGGGKAVPARVLTIMQSAVNASPQPFQAVVVVRNAALQAVGNSPVLVAHVNEGAIAMAEYAPDNPLGAVTVESSSDSSKPAADPSHSVTTDAGGSLLLQIDGVPLTPQDIPPASPSDGRR